MARSSQPVRVLSTMGAHTASVAATSTAEESPLQTTFTLRSSTGPLTHNLLVSQTVGKFHFGKIPSMIYTSALCNAGVDGRRYDPRDVGGEGAVCRDPKALPHSDSWGKEGCRGTRLCKSGECRKRTCKCDCE